MRLNMVKKMKSEWDKKAETRKADFLAAGDAYKVMYKVTCYTPNRENKSIWNSAVKYPVYFTSSPNILTNKKSFQYVMSFQSDEQI